VYVDCRDSYILPCNFGIEKQQSGWLDFVNLRVLASILTWNTTSQFPMLRDVLRTYLLAWIDTTSL
jgi:hypothetical protein